MSYDCWRGNSRKEMKMDKNLLADAYLMQRFGKTTKDVNVREVLEAIKEVSMDLYEQTGAKNFHVMSEVAKICCENECVSLGKCNHSEKCLEEIENDND